MRPDDRGWVIDRDDTRSADNLEARRWERHVALEYTVDIDLKLRSGEG